MTIALFPVKCLLMSICLKAFRKKGKLDNICISWFLFSVFFFLFFLNCTESVEGKKKSRGEGTTCWSQHSHHLPAGPLRCYISWVWQNTVCCQNCHFLSVRSCWLRFLKKTKKRNKTLQLQGLADHVNKLKPVLLYSITGLLFTTISASDKFNE